jgi:hypothetical protein
MKTIKISDFEIDPNQFVKGESAKPQEKPVAVIYDAFNQKGLQNAEEAIADRLNGNVRVINREELVKHHPSYDIFKDSPEELEKQKNSFGQKAAKFLMADAIQNRLNVAIEQGMDKTETPEQNIADFKQAAYQVVGCVNVDKQPDLKQQVKTDSVINNLANRAESIYEAKLTDQFIVAENKQHIFDSNDAPRYGNPVAVAINAAHKGVSIKDELKKEFGQTVEVTKNRITEENKIKESQQQGYDKQSMKL